MTKVVTRIGSDRTGDAYPVVTKIVTRIGSDFSGVAYHISRYSASVDTFWEPLVRCVTAYSLSEGLVGAVTK